MNKQKYLISGIIVIVALLAVITVIQNGGTNDGMTSAFSVVDIAPGGFEYQEPDDISKDAANESIKKAEQEIEEMKELNFPILFPSDALKEAKNSFADGNYEQVFKVTQLISYIKREKLDFMDKVRLLEVKKQVLEEKGASMKKINEVMQQAMNAFSLEQFEDANELLDEAKDEINEASKERIRLKTVAVLSKNFFVRNWLLVLIVVLVLVLFTPTIFSRVRKSYLKNKIASLKLDLDKTTGLIKALQKECFIEHKINTDTYHDRVLKYEERIAEIKHSLPILEARLARESFSYWGLIKKPFKRKGTKVVTKKKKAVSRNKTADWNHSNNKKKKKTKNGEVGKKKTGRNETEVNSKKVAKKSPKKK